MSKLLFLLASAAAAAAQDCPDYLDYANQRNPPFSSGIYEFPSQRPAEGCRNFTVPEVEATIKDMSSTISDPDLFRLFENTWPSTVDTTVKWQGKSADNPDEELAFIITGDINAMWMRDSANQLQSYKAILHDDQIDALYRGAINLQGRYMRLFPHCNAFQPPPESGMPAVNEHPDDVVTPAYDPEVVFECKYEIDSLGAFFQLSYDYYHATGDGDFFGKFQWKESVRSVLDTVKEMMQGTYNDDGSVRESPYTWQRESPYASETLVNKGAGAPVKGGLGLVRSFFRPSDDSVIYQYFIPGNMMLARYLEACVDIMQPIDAGMAQEMADIASGIRKGIQEHAVVKHPQFGDIYAFEVDGYGSHSLMDDSNLPSLLSIPHLGYSKNDDEIYKNTRAFALSTANPYYAHGPVINATGGPHLGPGMGWPMAVITQILTSDDNDEITGGIKQLMGSTSGLGLMHESVNSHNESLWTRPW